MPSTIVGVLDFADFFFPFFFPLFFLGGWGGKTVSLHQELYQKNNKK